MITKMLKIRYLLALLLGILAIIVVYLWLQQKPLTSSNNLEKDVLRPGNAAEDNVLHSSNNVGKEALRPSNNVEEDVLRINSNYSEIQKGRVKYLSRIVRIPSQTTEGAEMIVYFDKSSGDTKIVELSYGGETFKHDFGYFFGDINNFLLMERNQRWDRPFYVEEGRKQVSDDTQKYYFSQLHMIRWIGADGFPVDPEAKEFDQKEKEILNQLADIMDSISQGK